MCSIFWPQSACSPMNEPNNPLADPDQKPPPAKRVTLRDVAEDAGVSRATASLVLRNSPLVADATRDRVRLSMQKLGYVYNRAAANLRAQYSRTIGLAVTDITNPFFAELAVNIENGLDAADYAVLLTNTSDQQDKQGRLLEALHGYQIDGLLLCPAQGTTHQTIEQLQNWHLPVVLVTRSIPNSDADYVGADNVAGAEMAVAHLIAKGHQRITFIGGPQISSARQERLKGYRNALTEANLHFDERLSITTSVTREGGFQAIQKLLSDPTPPTAALCYNDVVAFGAMLGLQALHKTPGKDVAIIGFDDIADAALVRPALTTVSIPPQQIADAAVDLLLQRIADPNRPTQHLTLSPTLIIRDSCGASHST